MFGSMVRRLWRRPWSLALLGGLVVLLGAAFFVAGPGGSGLFGLTVGGCEIKPDTQCAGKDLRESDLRGANLSGANLSGANLYWAILTGANLTRANLNGADLRGSNLNGANLTSADLTADLTGANLIGTNLTGAEVALAEFDGALFCKTTWVDGSRRTTPGVQC